MNNADVKVYNDVINTAAESLSELAKKSSEIKANLSITILKRSLNKYINE